jgi:penicillin-binding protein 1C
VSARTALGASLNVPAVRTLVMVSPDAFHRQLKAVGLPLKESGDYYGYSLALGSSEVSLLSLANAYRTLANGGRYSAPSLAKNPKPVFKPALDARAAFIATDIMADPLARARTFGTDSILATRFWTAVKTGTSKDMRDNWAMGFSQRYTVGVWVGNASGAPMWDVSGTSGAAPIWAALMNYLHKTERSRARRRPPGLVQSRAQFGNQGGQPLEAARSEWFIQGTEQAVFAMNSGAETARPAKGEPQTGKKTTEPDAPARITAPASGTIIALDPDIPPKHQRVSFSAEGRGTRWLMDGKEFARGPRRNGCPGRAGTWCSWSMPAARWPTRSSSKCAAPGCARPARVAARLRHADCHSPDIDTQIRYRAPNVPFSKLPCNPHQCLQRTALS